MPLDEISLPRRSRLRQAGIFRGVPYGGVTGPPTVSVVAARARETGVVTTEQTELGRFLRTRRASVRPADVGLPAGPGTRRTPGLRREELATPGTSDHDAVVLLDLAGSNAVPDAHGSRTWYEHGLHGPG